jgi:hypothetical protein
MSLRIYLEDLAGGTNHVELFSSTSQYEWPVGWHVGKLVLGVHPVLGGSAGWYHVVDPKSATRLATLGGATCSVVGPLSPAGTACYEAPSGTSEIGSLKAVDWSGLTTTFYHYKGGGWAPLSPDGGSIYINESASAPSFAVVRRDGGKTVLALEPCAVGPGSPWWVDDQHLLYHALVQDQCGFAILDLVSGSQVKVPALTGSWADLVSRLPGGL